MAEANAIAARLRPGRAPVVARSRKPLCMTPKQAEVLGFLRTYFTENDQIPPVSATAQHFGISTGAAHWHMQQLEHHGAIEKNAAGRWRFARGAR